MQRCVRLNISIPRGQLAAIDAELQPMQRSRFLALAAMMALSTSLERRAEYQFEIDVLLGRSRQRPGVGQGGMRGAR